MEKRIIKRTGSLNITEQNIKDFILKWEAVAQNLIKIGSTKEPLEKSFYEGEAAGLIYCKEELERFLDPITKYTVATVDGEYKNKKLKPS